MPPPRIDRHAGPAIDELVGVVLNGPGELDVAIRQAAGRNAGVDDGALLQAIHIGSWFNVANGTADAYGLSAPTAQFLPGAVRFLSAVGYRL